MTNIEKDRSLLNIKNKYLVNKWKNDPVEWKKYKDHSFNTTRTERQLMYRMPLELGEGNYADIGVLEGQTSACILHGISDSKQNSTLYSVDLFGTGQRKESGFKTTPERLKSYIREQNLNANLKICIGDSSTIGANLDKLFNFIFIDADHSYEGCKKDFLAWGRLVKLGGRVAFHDCHLLTVNKVIEELGPEWKLIDHVYSTKLFERLK